MANQYKRYADEVGYPLIEETKRAIVEGKRLEEEGAKSKVEHASKMRDLKNAMKQLNYNKRMRQIERVEERNRQIENHFYGIKENPDDKVTIVLSRALPPELEEKE